MQHRPEYFGVRVCGHPGTRLDLLLALRLPPLAQLQVRAHTQLSNLLRGQAVHGESGCAGV